MSVGILKPWIKWAYEPPADPAGQTYTVCGLSGGGLKILHNHGLFKKMVHYPQASPWT